MARQTASQVPGRHLDAQALRTRPHRHNVWTMARLDEARSIVDVGCGSGAVTRDLEDWSTARVVAVDLDLGMAHATAGRGVPAVAADGARLPFPDAAFDAAVCHLMLLWADEPARVVAEMTRVVRPGGLVVAAMEPDYGAKVHHPENPLVDMVWKGLSIKRRGGDPHAGRKLRGHFVDAGLRPTVGVGNPDVLTPDQDLEMWRRNRRRYRAELRSAGFPADEIDGWEREYVAALEDGSQLSWFPLFYAYARKPVPGDVDRR